MMQSRPRPRSVHVLVGELLLREHTPDCIEELADLLRTDDRFNRWCFGLKQGTQRLKQGITADQFIKATGEHYEAEFGALVTACDAYLAAEWPRDRSDIWLQTRDALRSAVVAYTHQLAELHARHAAA